MPSAARTLAATDRAGASDRHRSSAEGEHRDAVYVDVVTFGALAESVREYLTRAGRSRSGGPLELDEWENAACERRSRHKVVADEVEFLARPREED